jgi:MOSC domain-containing protein YiiM
LASIIAVCRSDDKGTTKEAVPEAELQEDFGLAGDAHADCCTHRQVSLLAIESINTMREAGYDVKPGDFAENLTTEGMDLVAVPIGTVLRAGEDALLEVTQIGKDCHTGCAIFRQVGKCIMPRQGIFARVITGGVVRPGDQITRKDT